MHHKLDLIFFNGKNLTFEKAKIKKTNLHENNVAITLKIV